MGYAENAQSALRIQPWQDYRGSKEAIVINFECSKSTELPVRDILDENGKGRQIEPNIETGAYGYFQCFDARTRNSFVKKRKGYLLFLTNYQGTLEGYRGRDFIVGYYRILQTADVRKFHMRNFSGELCPEIEYCHALRAGEMKFVKIQDGLELTADRLKSWGYKGKLNRQLRLAFDEEKVTQVLEHFAQKEDQSASYISQIEKLLVKAHKQDEIESETGGSETPA